MYRKILAFSAVVTLLVALLASTGAANAARTGPSMRASSPTLDLSAMQKHCAVLDVYLNSATPPRVSCLHRQMPAKKASVKPNSSIGACDGNETMAISYTDPVFGPQTACVHGTGYQGLRSIDNVTEVDVFVSTAWFRWYDSSGGHYCTLSSSDSNPSVSLLTPNVTVTQVNPGNTNFGPCG